MRRLLVTALCAALLGSGPDGSDPVLAPRYGRDVRPILADRGFSCHGPDANKRRAHLRLDLAEDATAPHETGTPLVPGDPASSELWMRINSTDPDVHMPPPTSTKQPLSAPQKEAIRAWIAAGAKYEKHWA